MARIHNFSAGPGVLPLPVLQEAQQAILGDGAFSDALKEALAEGESPRSAAFALASVTDHFAEQFGQAVEFLVIGADDMIRVRVHQDSLQKN